MPGTSELQFGPYRLIGPQGPFFRDSQEVKLPPKALAVLWELTRQAGQVVTKAALLDAVWPETVVGEAVLAFQMQTLRQALSDDAKQPRYIATAHRIGYRFIAPLTTAPPVVSSQLSVVSDQKPTAPDPQLATGNWQLPTSVVGREAELAQLRTLFAKALNGERQMVFVTGEAGIGKTTLVDALLAQISRVGTAHHNADETAGTVGVAHPTQALMGMKGLSSPTPDPRPLTPNPWIGRGQCVEHYGVGEAYLPVLEALGRLCRQPDGEQLIDVLRRVAPTWLVQLPTVVNEAEHAALRQKLAGTTRERMLREMTEALEVLSTAQPVILLLEDLHWSDVSTIDLLAMLARRREAARLFILGTYRPAELVVTNHPLKTLKHELVARGQGVEIPLRYLKVGEVRTYVTQRLADSADDRALSEFVYRRTEGHPLFMVQVADYLAQQGTQTATGPIAVGAIEAIVPQGLRELIEVQVGRLTEAEQQVLEVGSVAGAEFTVASVAVGVQTTVEAVEDLCESLGQRGQFIEERGLATWPDGTVSGRYGFRHALYQEVLYQRLSMGRRARLHRVIGGREEVGYGERASEVAAALAMHFEQGHDSQRAVRYLRQAGVNALRRNAFHEAIHALSRGLTLLATLPESPERDQQELVVQLALGSAFVGGETHSVPGVEHAYTRARALCHGMGETPQLFLALSGIVGFYSARGFAGIAAELAQQCLQVAQRLQHPVFLPSAHGTLGVIQVALGAFADAREQCAQATAFYDARPHRSRPLPATIDQEVLVRSYLGLALWMLGYPDQGLQSAREALTLAKQHEHPPSLGVALSLLGMVSGCCGKAHTVHEVAEQMILMAQEQGLRVWHADGSYARGEALVLQGQYAAGSVLIRQAVAECTDIGVELGQSWRAARLAEAQGHMGQVAEGLRLLAEAEEKLTTTGERFYEAELWRLKGELTLRKFQVPGSKFQVKNSPKSKVESPKSKVNNPQSAIRNPQLEEAEACFQQALEVARRQQAKSLELRAGTSLARLWQQHGKGKDAHTLLAEIYHWFTEGFDTKDLQEAQALLEELSH